VAFNAGDIEAVLTLDRSPFNEGLTKARADAERFEKRGIKLKVDVDKSFTGQIQRAINDTQKSTGKGIRLPITVDQRTVNDVKNKIDEIADNTETTARRSGNRMARALLNPLVIQLGLLPGIAAASAAAAGLSFMALPAVFAAVGVAALKNNEELKETYSDLWQEIKTGAEEIAQPLITTFQDVAQRVTSSWREMKPELAQLFLDIDPLIKDLTDGVLGFAEEALPKMRQALALSGPTVRGVESMLKSLGSGFGDLTVNMSTNSMDMGNAIEIVGNMLESLLGTVGTLISQFGSFFSDIGPQFARVFDKLLSTVTGFTEGGLQGLGQGLTVTLGIVEGFLNVLGPFAEIFGQVGGQALAVVGSLKLLGGALGVVGKLWGLISPAGTIQRLAGFSTSISNAAASMGGFVTRVSGSEKAGDRFTSVTQKMGNAVVKTTAYIPLLGTAIGVAAAAIDHFWPSADELANKISQGGAAAAEARGQMYSIADGYNRGSLTAQTFAATSEEVRAAIDKQREGMTAIERAQADAAKAQRDYDYAVDQFGPTSKEATDAQINLAGATDDLAREQDKAARATETHTDAIIRQTNQLLAAVGSRLSYQQALLSMEQSQRDLTKAVEEHGAGSLEARQADMQYQQSILSVINALGARVMAENAARGEQEATRLSTLAMHMEIARLAVAAGENLPPALAEMAAGLSEAELRAMGVTKEVDGTGQAIYRLPPGKELTFPSNAPVATDQVNSLGRAIDNIKPSKWITFYLNYVTTGATPPKGATPSDPSNQGTIPFKAKGGPVMANRPYWVGDAGLPELFFPNVDGFVLNGKDSMKLADSARSGAVSPAPAGFSVGGGDSEMDYEALGQATAQALASVLDGAKLVVDGDGIARIVNQTNLRNAAR